IPAAAAAFSLAIPTSSRVRIDALWGLPDGLQSCAHDSYELRAYGGGSITRKIRYKGTFLSAQNDKWELRPLSAPYDWSSSLPESSVRRIAELSKAIAKMVARPVQIMWFARLASNSGHPDPLPWRFTTEQAPSQVDSGLARRFNATSFVVRHPSDIELLE